LIEKGCEAVSVVEMLRKLHPVPTKESMSAISAEKNGRQYTYRGTVITATAILYD
jgi:hypothetical protein